MAGNTNEEHIDKPTNTQSEDLSAEVITNTKTTNPTPKTDNMEVHHHSHAGHGKKSWKSYFWEFFMLFLAVFCGFLAEYQLERTVEHHKEKQYIIALVHDLENDTLQFGLSQKRVQNALPAYDSIRSFFKDPTAFNNKLSFKYWSRFGGGAYIPTEPTIQQLKNTGSLRLVEKRMVLDSILVYDSHINIGYHNQTNLLQENYNDFLHFKGRVFDQTYASQYFDDVYNGTVDTTKNYDLILDSDNETDIRDLKNTFGTMKVSNIFYLEQLKRIKREATALIKLIKEEYLLE